MRFKTLFFENIGIKQTILKNTLWLGFSELISRLLEFVLIVYIVRILGVGEFGKFTFALAFVSMFMFIFDLGISDITTREFASNKDAEKDYNAIFSLKVILNIITFILILAASFFATQDAAVRFIIWILGVFVLTNDFFYNIYSFLRARQRMEFEAAAKILRSLILVFFVFFALFKTPSVKNVALGYFFANLLTLILVLIFFYFKIYSLKFDFNKNIWKKFIKISWPLGLAAVFGAVMVNVDSVIMGYLGQITENGLYNASRKMVGVIILSATFIFMSFYPPLSRIFNESIEKLQRIWNYYLETMIVTAVPIAVGGFFLAPRIINFVFGQNFGPSVFVFQILIFMAAISFICYPYNLILIVSRQQKKYFWIYLISFLVNIFLNLILIPRYSLYGAAASSLTTSIVLFLLSIEFSRRFTPIVIFNLRLLKILLISVFTSFIMLVLINKFLFYNGNIFLSIISGALVYFSILFYFKKAFLKNKNGY